MTDADTAEIAAALSDFYTPAETLVWLDAPHPQLAGRTARSVIDAGGKDEVLAVIARLNECVYL